MSGEAVPPGAGNGQMCLGLQMMYENLRVLGELRQRQERVLAEALQLQADMNQFKDNFTQRVNKAKEDYPLIIKPRKVKIDLDTEFSGNGNNSNLPSPLVPVKLDLADKENQSQKELIPSPLSQPNPNQVLSQDIGTVQFQQEQHQLLMQQQQQPHQQKLQQQLQQEQQQEQQQVLSTQTPHTDNFNQLPPVCESALGEVMTTRRSSESSVTMEDVGQQSMDDDGIRFDDGEDSHADDIGHILMGNLTSVDFSLDVSSIDEVEEEDESGIVDLNMVDVDNVATNVDEEQLTSNVDASVNMDISNGGTESGSSDRQIEE